MIKDGSGGPLAGIKVVEFSGIGPVPFCAMMLADMGATVTRIDRVTPSGLGIERETRFELALRGRRSISLDLKKPAGLVVARKLIAGADCLIEGFRPGVMERFGLGPDECLQRNPKLVYGRMTGYGQDGPLAQAVGHDINYLAASGVLHCIGRAGTPPLPPLNLVADLGGGAMYLAFGVACALIEARGSGRGQVVDAAMVDGAASLAVNLHGLRAAGIWSERHGDNFLDSGAPWYDCYETLDGRYMAVGAIEGKFYQAFLAALGVETAGLPKQYDRSGWPVLRQAFAEAFRTKTRAEWTEIMGRGDTCCTPVLSLEEAAAHPHSTQRNAYTTIDEVTQPMPAPRFSRTASHIPVAPVKTGHDTNDILEELGFDRAEIELLQKDGAAIQAS